MKDFVRFVPVEVVSQVCIISGKDRTIRFRVVSYLLIPSFRSGKPVISESMIPEIFLQ